MRCTCIPDWFFNSPISIECNRKVKLWCTESYKKRLYIQSSIKIWMNLYSIVMIDRNHRHYLCDGDKGLRTNTHSVARTSKQYARNVCSPIVYSVEMKICRKKQSSYIFVIMTDWKAYVLNALLLIAITYCMLPNQVFKKRGFLKADERLVLGFQRFSVKTYVPILMYRM